MKSKRDQSDAKFSTTLDPLSRDTLARNEATAALERAIATWPTNSPAAIRVCTYARLIRPGVFQGHPDTLFKHLTCMVAIEDALISKDVDAVYALAGNGFSQHNEEAFNALQGDNSTAS